MLRSIAIPLLILSFILSFLMHFDHFNKDVMSMHVWRQAQTQSNIQNFYEEDMNIFNPRRNERGDGDGIFRMEFPLMQWMVAAVYPVFGPHIEVSRLFMFLISVFSILGMFMLLNNLFGEKLLAAFGAWAFAFSPSFYYHSINPLPDNLALCLGIWGLALFYRWVKTQSWTYALLCGILLSLSTLSKLPFVLFYAVPGIHFLVNLLSKKESKKNIAAYLQIFGFIVFPFAWYIKVIPQWEGNGITGGIMDNNSAPSQVLDNLQHHLISSLPETLLNYGSLLFFIMAFVWIFKRKAYRHKYFGPLAAFGFSLIAYLLFEANMIGKSHDYYLFPFYPVLFILVGYGAYNLFIFKPWAKVLTLALLISLPFLCFLRMEGRWNPDSPGFDKDLLTYKSELRSAAPDSSLVIAGNDGSHFIFMYYIDKKGWGFVEDDLSLSSIEDMINRGAEYLYSNSEKINAEIEKSSLIELEVGTFGSIRVFKLRKAKNTLTPEQ